MSTQQERKKMLALRDALPVSVREFKSEQISDTLRDLINSKNIKTIFSYVSFRSEVDTLKLIESFLAQNKKVLVPKTMVHEKRMDIYPLEDISTDLISGYCGILEPSEKLIKKGAVDTACIDCVIVPGSVFDERGGRFGYGGGYYDRFLAQIPNALRIGLAFDIQVVDMLPLYEHDQTMDYTITEKRIIRAKRRETSERGRS